MARRTLVGDCLAAPDACVDPTRVAPWAESRLIPGAVWHIRNGASSGDDGAGVLTPLSDPPAVYADGRSRREPRYPVDPCTRTHRLVEGRNGRR